MKKRKHNICDYNVVYCHKCDNEHFKIEQRNGAGGSGTYFKFICLKCNNIIERDFENPDYDG